MKDNFKITSENKEILILALSELSATLSNKIFLLDLRHQTDDPNYPIYQDKYHKCRKLLKEVHNAKI